MKLLQQIKKHAGNKIKFSILVEKNRSWKGIRLSFPAETLQ